MSRASLEVDRRRRPVAGFPTQTAACRALADQGLKPDEIARQIDRNANHVRAMLRQFEHGVTPRSFPLPVRLKRALAAEARARGVTPAELATQLLDLVIADDLFEPLLGEREGGDA